MNIAVLVLLAFTSVASGLRVINLPAQLRSEANEAEASSLDLELESVLPGSLKLDRSRPNFGWEEPAKGKNGHFDWTALANERGEAMKNLPKNMSIVMYGDSMAELLMGSLFGKVSSRASKYAAVFQKYFTHRYGPSHASGIGGDQIQQLLYRIQHGESPKEAQPRVIMVLVGTTNILKEYLQVATPEEDAQAVFAATKKLVRTLQHDSPHSTIVLNGMFPRTPQWGSTTPNKIEQSIVRANQLIKEGLASEPTIRYAGCEHALLGNDGKHIDKDLIRSDFIHPTAAGFEKWAACLQPTLDSILLQ